MGCNNSINNTYLMTDPVFKGKAEGETEPFVNFNYHDCDGYMKDLEKSTILSEVLKSMLKHSTRDALGYRKQISSTDVEGDYQFIKYGALHEMCKNFSKNVVLNKLYEEINFDDEKGVWNIVGIFSRNCLEWVVTDIGLQMNDITSVTFYSTLGSESFDHIFKQTQVSTVCCSPDSLKTLADFHKSFKFATLKNVIVYDYTQFISDDKKEVQCLIDLGLNIYYFSDLIKSSKTEIKLNNVEAESVLTLCYTSGTTSLPKGAMLTQRGFASQISLNLTSGINYTCEDVILSYLPLAHVMERVNVLVALSFGAKIGFISGNDIKKFLMDDLVLLKPTIFVAVPRILVNFHQKVLEGFTKLTGCAKSMADGGLETKRVNFEKNYDIKHWYYDSLVFSKVRAKFGGRVRVIITGSAPLPKDVLRDIKLLMSCSVLEGYGMTELHGGSVSTHVSDTCNFNVGGVLRELRLKLVDKKELNYHSKTEFEGKLAPTGEICFKGHGVFKGYFRDSKNTKESIDENGWLHTGDVGRIDPSNKGLKIIDRVKEIFKLSQGEYIAPAKLEGMYAKCPLVAQICIYGNSEKSSIIAIVVVNKLNVALFLKENGLIENEKEDIVPLLNNEKLLAEYKKQFDSIAKDNKFTSLEKPSKFILTTYEFTSQNDLLTPTMKLVRKKIQNHFQKEIDKAYE